MFRFAPLIRVSIEKQEMKAESLRTQRERIIDCVRLRRGIIPDNCWCYCGQEHATPEFERVKFNQLLEDCTKNKFDAVIVDDPSRWSRDNLRHEEGIRILKANRIRFFVGTIETDLFDPNHELTLNIGVVVSQYQAKLTKLKSILNRISRAKRNIPSTGKLPYGRTFDRKTGKWDLDPEKVEKIRYASERYLEDESMDVIAVTVGLDKSHLWRIMNERSGGKWIAKFSVPDLNVDETVTLTIPPLLDDQTIKAIRMKAEANTTYHRKALKYN